MPLSPTEFEAVIRMRGYSLSEVAARWGLSPARLTQIKADVLRSPRYEDALWGLPAKKLARAVTIRREHIAHRLAGERSAKDRKKIRREVPSFEPTFLIEVGDIWAVARSPGEHLPEGCEGTIVAVERHESSARISFRFVNGFTETIDQNYLLSPDCFLVATGKTVRVAAG